MPYASSYVIAHILGETQSIVYRYLTRELGLVYKFSRYVPHRLENYQKMNRVIKSHELLSVLKTCKHNGWRDIITGDQSWFGLCYGSSGKWCFPDESNPIIVKDKIYIEKVMLTVIWGVNDFYVIDFLPQGAKYNSSYFIEHILTKLYEKKEIIWPKNAHRNIWLHLDNCRVHNSKVTMSKTEEYGFKRAPHPEYSPDIAPSDFFLFGYVKEKLKNHAFDTLEDLKESIIEILSQISRDMRKSVFEEWIKRCTKVIELHGEYIV